MRPQALQRVERVLGADRREVVGLLEARDAEAGGLEVRELLLRELLDVVVEAGDLHPPGAGVEDLADELRQLGDRVARDARRWCPSAGRSRRSRGCNVIGCSPRRPADCAGRPRDTHTVSETTTASVAAAGPIARSVSAKWGEPTSSSSSQRTLMLTGTPASIAARAPKSAESAGPLVVGGAAAEVGVALLREREGVRPPGLGLPRRRAPRRGGCRWSRSGTPLPDSNEPEHAPGGPRRRGGGRPCPRRRAPSSRPSSAQRSRSRLRSGSADTLGISTNSFSSSSKRALCFAA